MTEQPKEKIKTVFRRFGHSIRRINNHLFYSFKLFYRSKLTIFLFVITPIILLLLFGSIFAEHNMLTYDLLVQNHDDSPYADDLIRLLNENIFLVTEELDETLNPTEYMQQNKKIACLVLPIDWYEHSLIYPKTNATLIIDSYSSSAQRIEHLVRKVMNEFTIQQNNTELLVDIELIDFYSSTFSYIDFVMPGLIGVIIMNTGILGTIIRQVHYRKTGLMRKFATTPLTRLEYISAELIWQFLIALIVTLLTVFASWLIFGFSWSSFTAMILPVIIVGVVLFTGLGLVISQIVKENALLLGLLFTIPMMFLSGVFFDISGIKSLIILSKFFPLSYIVEAVRASMITGSSVTAGINIAIALSIGIVFIIIGIFITRWEKQK
ncbi:MAG: ABC transporter permease [Asgard group archaeon]|nr:ABC transporter permease [Asgard group archaeon]